MNANEKRDLIKAQLPPGTKLGFILDIHNMDKNSAVVFHSPLSGRIVQAYFDGEILQPSRSMMDAMDDDGLSEVMPMGQAKRVLPSEKLMWDCFHRKFRPVSKGEAYLALFFLPGLQLVVAQKYEIAIGEDLVFLKDLAGKFAKFDRVDWTFADQIMHILNQYPLYLEQKKKRHLQTANIGPLMDALLNEMEDVVLNEQTSRMVLTMWQVLDDGIAIAEFHPELAPRYLALKQKCHQMVLG